MNELDDVVCVSLTFSSKYRGEKSHAMVKNQTDTFFSEMFDDDTFVINVGPKQPFHILKVSSIFRKILHSGVSAVKFKEVNAKLQWKLGTNKNDIS